MILLCYPSTLIRHIGFVLLTSLYNAHILKLLTTSWYKYYIHEMFYFYFLTSSHINVISKETAFYLTLKNLTWPWFASASVASITIFVFCVPISASTSAHSHRRACYILERFIKTNLYLQTSVTTFIWYR